MLEVADRGLGIAPEYHEAIFNKFFRVENEEASTNQGSGLGLFLVQHAVDAHGGRIEVQSQPGQGRDSSPPAHCRRKDPRRKKGEAIMSKILIIEDDSTLQQGLAETLQFHGFETFSARDGRSGLKLLTATPRPDRADIMLPGVDGYEICKQVRRQDEKTLILMLTARDRENDKLLGFEQGADDYLTKPFSIKELVARVQALLKRTTPEKETPTTVRIGTAEVLFRRFEIRRGGQTLEMTPKENAILRLLVAFSPEVVSRDRIMDRIWGDEYDPSPRTIDNFILKLRQKIELDPARPEHLLTVHGASYKLIM